MDDAMNFALHGCFLAREFESSPPTQLDEFYKSCQAVADAFTQAMNCCLNSRNPPTPWLRLADVNVDQAEFAGIENVLSRAMGLVVPSNCIDPLVQLGGSNGQSLETAVAEPSVSGAAGFQTPPRLKEERIFREMDDKGSGTTGRERRQHAGRWLYMEEVWAEGDIGIRISKEPCALCRLCSSIFHLFATVDPSNTEQTDGFVPLFPYEMFLISSRNRAFQFRVFCRSYYRCTHKAFYGCDAKKQVQRTDGDPRTYEITYCGQHTCHTIAPLPPATNPIGTAEKEALQPFPAGGVSGAGPLLPVSEAQAISIEQQLLEYADAIFNSGSGSSSNSMDSIFSHKGER